MITAEQILRAHPQSIQTLSARLRKIVHQTLPSVTERAYPGWHAIGFRDPEAGYICGLFPFDDYVQLIFEHGAMLTDTNGLLEGQQLKQVRYITLRPGRRLPLNGIKRLLIAALHYSSLRARSPRRRKT